MSEQTKQVTTNRINTAMTTKKTTKPLLARIIKVLQKVEKELGSRKEGNWPLYCAVRKILDEVENAKRCI